MKSKCRKGDKINDFGEEHKSYDRDKFGQKDPSPVLLFEGNPTLRVIKGEIYSKKRILLINSYC